MAMPMPLQWMISALGDGGCSTWGIVAIGAETR